MNIGQFIEEIATCQGKTDMETLVRKGKERKRGMERLLHQHSQFAACHVIQVKGQAQHLGTFGKLFVLGTNRALQMTAGQALKQTLLRTLCKNNDLKKMQSLEQTLRGGFTTESICMNSSLTGLLVEVYTLTTMCVLLAYRESDAGGQQKFHLSKDSLDIALRKFETKCTQLHQSITDHVSFHIGLTLDLLHSELWSTKKHTIDDIFQTVQFLTHANPEDRVAAEDNIVKKLMKSKLTKAEECLLLHYFASVAQQNPSTLNMCHEVFIKELDRSQGSRLKQRSKKLLFSCALLLLSICTSISHHGKY